MQWPTVFLAAIILAIVRTPSANAKARLKKRMIDGDPTGGPISWLVSIQDENRSHFCGGSLISPTTVLTAAHCFYGLSPDDYRTYTVSANRYNLADPSERAVDFNITEVHNHPDYNEETMANDIAVLKISLRSDSQISDLTYVQMDDTNAGLRDRAERKLRSLSLEEEAIKNTGLDLNKFADKSKGEDIADKIQGVDKDNELNDNLFAAGWGTLSAHSETPSVLLQKASMKPALHSRCKLMSELEMDLKSVTCALGANFNSDTCSGDSGGPLYYEKDGVTKLIGITSYGIGCSREKHVNGLFIQYPGVYTRVHYFKDFIQQYVTDQAPAAPATQEPIPISSRRLTENSASEQTSVTQNVAIVKVKQVNQSQPEAQNSSSPATNTSESTPAASEKPSQQSLKSRVKNTVKSKANRALNYFQERSLLPLTFTAAMMLF